jgi:integrase
MKLTFTHAGTNRTLAKHPQVMAALKQGLITEEQAKAKPWYLRLTSDGKAQVFKLCGADFDAVRAAKDILRGQRQHPAQFSAFIAQREAKRSITVGALADEWVEMGLPFRKTEIRTPDAANRLRATLDRCLKWWREKPVAIITANTIEDYAAHRAPAFRSTDLELAALSCLFKWAVLTGKVEKNPMESRPRFAKVKQHCHEACPEDDEILHKLLAYLFRPTADAHHQAAIRQTILAGATLAFCALTGLRPGEPAALLRSPILEEPPANTRTLPPGTIFRDRLGVLRMKVQRLKNGQNPFVTLHPAAEEFLTAWKAWLARELPDEPHLFPLCTTDQTTLNRALDRASKFYSLPHYKPHAMRAYYVKVRRAQGEDDATISGELGQTTNGQLIRDVYGDPQDLLGGNLFDWLPEDCAPAWSLLALPAPVKADTDAVTRRQ